MEHHHRKWMVRLYRDKLHAHNKVSVRSIFALSHPISFLSPFHSHSPSSLPSSLTPPPLSLPLPLSLPPLDKIRGVHSMGLDQVHGSLGPPSFTSPLRSPSYHTMELGKEKPFRDELRQTSKSEYDIASSTKIKMEIEANVRVSKSGKVIGPSSRGSSRRPSIFDQSAASSDGEWDDSHVSRTSTSPRSIEGG